MCVKAPLSTRDMSPLFFILSLLQCLYLLHGLNHTACYNSELIIDSPLCGNSGNLAPKKFLLGQLSPNSTCRTRLSGQRDYHIVRDCCKFHGGDTVIEEVCIPGQKMRLSSPLSHMARYCSRGHRCDSGKRLTSKELHSGDYVSLEYDCVHVKEEIHFNSDEVLNGRKVYLISDQKDGSVRDAKCAAYKTNPRSSIIVTLVDNIVSSGACTVSFASSMYGSTNINCAKTEIVNGCNNVLYSSNTSRVDINLTMTVIADGSDRQFLWMVVTASDGGNLTVACGTKIPPDDYTTASATQSTRSRLTTQKSSPNYTTTSYSKSTSDYPATIRATNSRGISKSSTLSTSAIATGLTIPHSISGSGGSTKIHLSKTNSMSHSSTGLQLTMSSSPLLTTFGRIQASSTTSTSLSTNMPSSLPPTSSQSHSTTETFSPSLTHSTTGGRLQSSRHTSYSTRPTQGQSLSSFNALSSSNVTLFRLIKTTKPSLHPLTVSIAGGSETAHTSTTSTSASTSTKSWQRLSSTTVTSKPPVDETTRDTIDTEGKGSSSPTVSTIGRMQSSKATSVSSETGQETSSSTTTPMPSTQGGIQHSTTTSSSSITDNGKPSNISTHTSATQHMLTALMFGASTSTKSWQRLSSTTVTSKPPPVDETTRDTMSIAGGSETAHTLTTSTSGRLRFTNITSFSPVDTEGKGSSSTTVSTIGRMQSSKATSVSSETGQETSSSTTTPMPSTQGGIQHSTTTSSSSITDNGKPSNISTHTSATQHMLTALMFGASTSTKSWQRLSSTTVTSKPPVDETTRDTIDTEGKGSSSPTVSTIGRMQSSKATSVSSETGQETSSSTTTPMPSTQGGIQHSTTTSSSSITDNGKPSNISTHTLATQHMLTALMFGASTSTKSWQRLSSTTVTSKPPPVDETTRDTIDTEGKGSSSTTVSTIGRMQSSKATSVSSETGQETSSSTTTPMPSTQGGIQHSTTTSSSSITDNGKPSNISTHTSATQHMLTALMFGASTSTKSWQRLSSTTVTSKPPPVDETTRDTMSIAGGSETAHTPTTSTSGRLRFTNITSFSPVDTEGKGSSSTTVSTIGRMQSSKATSVSSETGQETSSSTTTPMPSTQGGIQHSTTTSSSSITDNGKPSNISTHTSATQHMLTALMFGASTSTKSWQRLSSTTVTSKPPPVDETTRDTMSIAGGSKTAHTPTTSTSGRLRFTNITSFSPVDTEGKGSSSTTVSTIGRMQSSKATSVSSETGQETSSSTTTPMPSTQGGIQHSTTTSSSSITDNGKPSNISTHTSATQHMLTALMFGASTSTKSWQRLSSTTVTSKPPPVDETTRDTMSIAGGSGTAHTSTTSTSGRLRFTNITSFSPVDTEGKGSSSTTMSTIGRMQSSKATSVSSETGQETSSSTTTPMPSTQGGIQHSTTTSSSSITDNGKPSNISAHTSATQHMLTALMFGASTSTKSWQRLSSTTVTSKPPPVDETTRDTIDTEGKGSSSTTVSTIGRMQSSKATSVSSETGQETSSSTTTPMPSTQGGIQHSTTTSSSSITDNGKPSNISTHTSATQHMLTALMFGASTSTKSWQRLSSTTVKSSQPPVDETTRDTNTEGKGSSSTTVSTIGRMQSSKATSVSSETGQETSSSTTTPMPSTQGGIQHSTTTSSSSITDNGKPSNISTHTSATQHMLTALMFGASTSTKSWQRLSSTTVKSSQPPVDETTRDTRKSDNTDDKVAFILEVITSLTGAALLLLMVITTAMCLCYNKRMHELQRNSRKRKKLSGTNVSALELKRNSVVSLESGYDSISALR
ncbi:serine-rich adhesin for platelets-like isoform X3 [Haliotis rufescens]|uniref:serine-rich adhesin for platelets-like isoform X3 n=1 Tax=Haliotis rufescens TaxID=6454 RepID=UPI00201FA3D7|nr:serine-rich adhesin for platelets-like isoform X3 [Haliotis rufescens]